MADSLADLMQKMSITQYSVGSQHWVHITHINDPSDFYVRPTAYKDYLLRLKEHNGPADPSNLRFGSVVVFKSKTRKCHMRGEIRNIRDDDGKTVYDLFALDYGVTEHSISMERIKEPLIKYPMPSSVLHCQLADCQPKDNVKFDSKAIEAMQFYVGNERAKMVIQGRTADKYIVQLINSCPEDIATMMGLTGYSCFGYGNNIISRMPNMDQPKMFYTYKQVKVGETINVRVQSGSCLKSFYVCDVEDHKRYIQQLKDLKEYYHREQNYLAENLKSGKPLAVYSDWYARYERAIIREVVIPEKEAVVQLVDWGIKTNVHMGVTRLKALSREYYFSRPAMAIYCMADEKQVWDNGLLKSLYPGYEFEITIKKVGHEFETPNIVSISKK